MILGSDGACKENCFGSRHLWKGDRFGGDQGYIAHRGWMSPYGMRKRRIGKAKRRIGKELKGLGLADLEQQKTGRFKDIDSSLAGVPDVMG